MLSCPRCRRGNVFVEQDEFGFWEKKCVQCSWTRPLNSADVTETKGRMERVEFPRKRVYGPRSQGIRL